MKGPQKISFATATSKVFQTDDLYAKNISTVCKLHLSDGTDFLKVVSDMKTVTDKMLTVNESLSKQVQELTLKVKELETKVDCFEVEVEV